MSDATESLAFVEGGEHHLGSVSFYSDRYIPPEPEGDDSIRYSAFWGYLIDDIKGARQGGAKIVIDAENSALGSGKTSAAVALARRLASAFGYELSVDDLTLSGGEYIRRYREHPGKEQPSVLLLDEAVGAGAGDARRSMAQSNLDLAAAWQTARVKRVVTIVTVAHWGDMDSRLQRLSDYRLRCSEKPVGSFRPYKVQTDFSSGNVRTRKLDDSIRFPDTASQGCRFYEALDEMKSELLDASTWDADDLQEDEDSEDNEPEDEGPSLKAIADEVAENIDEYTSIHGGNGTEYVDKELIAIDYADEISGRDATKVKKLVERMEVAV